MNPHPQFRRRIIVIKRVLQMKYVTLVFLSVLLTVTVVSLDIYYVIGKVFVKELRETDLSALFRNASGLLAVHLAVLLLAVIIISVFVSHKFAGPVFRLERIAESVGKGDLTVRASFREGDELFETAECMNRMIDSLKEKVGRETETALRTRRDLAALQEELKSGKLFIPDAVRRLEEICASLEKIGADFKLQ